MRDWKLMIFGLGMFGVGFAGGYFLCKKTLREQYQEDVEEVKEFYMERLRDSGLVEDDEEIQTLDETYSEEKEIFEKMMKSYGATLNGRVDYSTKGKPVIGEKPPLSDFIFTPRLVDLEEDFDDLHNPDEDNYHYDEDEDEDEDFDARYEAEIEARAEDFTNRRYENELNGVPYVITHEEFMNAPEEYDMQMLYYYAKDRTLCEEDDTIVDDEEGLVGFDYEDVLDMQTNVWVRNDTLMTVYEIAKFNESYQEAVANMVETPMERNIRIIDRRQRAVELSEE